VTSSVVNIADASLRAGGNGAQFVKKLGDENSEPIFDGPVHEGTAE